MVTNRAKTEARTHGSTAVVDASFVGHQTPTIRVFQMYPTWDEFKAAHLEEVGQFVRRDDISNYVRMQSWAEQDSITSLLYHSRTLLSARYKGRASDVAAVYETMSATSKLPVIVSKTDLAIAKAARAALAVIMSERDEEMITGAISRLKASISEIIEEARGDAHDTPGHRTRGAEATTALWTQGRLSSVGKTLHSGDPTPRGRRLRSGKSRSGAGRESLLSTQSDDEEEEDLADNLTDQTKVGKETPEAMEANDVVEVFRVSRVGGKRSATDAPDHEKRPRNRTSAMAKLAKRLGPFKFRPLGPEVSRMALADFPTDADLRFSSTFREGDVNDLASHAARTSSTKKRAKGAVEGASKRRRRDNLADIDSNGVDSHGDSDFNGDDSPGDSDFNGDDSRGHSDSDGDDSDFNVGRTSHAARTSSTKRRAEAAAEGSSKRRRRDNNSEGAVGAASNSLLLLENVYETRAKIKREVATKQVSNLTFVDIARVLYYEYIEKDGEKPTYDALSKAKVTAQEFLAGDADQVHEELKPWCSIADEVAQVLKMDASDIIKSDKRVVDQEPRVRLRLTLHELKKTKNTRSKITGIRRQPCAREVPVLDALAVVSSSIARKRLSFPAWLARLQSAFHDMLVSRLFPNDLRPLQVDVLRTFARRYIRTRHDLGNDVSLTCFGVMGQTSPFVAKDGSFRSEEWFRRWVKSMHKLNDPAKGFISKRMRISLQDKAIVTISVLMKTLPAGVTDGLDDYHKKLDAISKCLVAALSGNSAGSTEMSDENLSQLRELQEEYADMMRDRSVAKKVSRGGEVNGFDALSLMAPCKLLGPKQTIPVSASYLCHIFLVSQQCYGKGFSREDAQKVRQP